jgi:hypothetical protein
MNFWEENNWWKFGIVNFSFQTKTQNIKSQLKIQQNNNLQLSSTLNQYQYYLHSSNPEVKNLKFLISRNFSTFPINLNHIKE